MKIDPPRLAPDCAETCALVACGIERKPCVRWCVMLPESAEEHAAVQRKIDARQAELDSAIQGAAASIGESKTNG